VSNVTEAVWRAWKNAPTDPPSAAVQDALDAAEEAIGDDCARLFVVADVTPTERLYVPTWGDPVLRIHDCVAVSAIDNDGVAVTDYQLEPVGDSWSGDSRPYTQIRLLGGDGWAVDQGRATVGVTARWGWTALPARYSNAVKILAADVLDSRDVRNGVIGMTDFAAVRVRENATVVKLLAKLRRAESWAVA